MASYDSYVICTSPRSGSTLLCNLLGSTGVAGNPDSWFHRPSVSSWLDHFNLTPEDSTPECRVLNSVFAAAIAKGSLDTGIFGLRLQRHSFDFFACKLAVLQPGLANDAQRFHAAFGRTFFIYLTRLDKVEQAVSYVRATQTGLWHVAPDGRELERLAPPQAASYDPDGIAMQVDKLSTFDCQWESWFEAEKLDPLRITYEALSAHPTDTLRGILQHLELDEDAASSVVPTVAKLADKTNQEWVMRFRGHRHE